MSKNGKKTELKIFDIDPWLDAYRDDLYLRASNYERKRAEILQDEMNIKEFANAHNYYGFHKTKDGWVYREWAPAADALYLTGDFNEWDKASHPMERNENGDWEIHLKGKRTLKHQSRVKVVVHAQGHIQYKIPLYANRVVQEVNEDGSIDFVAQIWDPQKPFAWTDERFKRNKNESPLIYETHVGLAQVKEGMGTYKEFEDNILPRIKAEGYNTVQFMAIMQHPYYGSFGYHVANFFAASSWFGTPEELKSMINKAHELGLTVLMDIVHSHAVKNVNEGINRFDGTQTQFFYEGDRGMHEQWDSMCFNYGKNEVIHFLLSNIKYWMEEYHFDGFRFDGVTSMLYWDHGMGTAFDSYDKYFSYNTNTDAITYLQFANELIHEINPNALVVAEDMSGMPGLCLPIADGGIGFDYRLAMGVPDFWIKTVKSNDYDWNMHQIYYELTTARPQEKRIAYAESHDQALVGDKTLFFWLTGPDIYWHMNVDDQNYNIDRSIALHKMIRLITISTGAEGYLNFIGNEFGHPEWIDFPRLENGWSYQYARRQWNLVDDKSLKYHYLADFDQDMISLVKKQKLMGQRAMQLLWIDQNRKLIAYRKSNHVFVYNFHPTDSYESFQLPLHQDGTYRVVMSTDRKEYGGYDRISEAYEYESKPLIGAEYNNGITIYIPSRTAMVLKKVRGSASKEEGVEEVDVEADEATAKTKKKKKVELPTSSTLDGDIDEETALELMHQAELKAVEALASKKQTPKSKKK